MKSDFNCWELLKEENKCEFKDLEVGDTFLHVISGAWFHMKMYPYNRDGSPANAVQLDYGYSLNLGDSSSVYKVSGRFVLNG